MYDFFEAALPWVSLGIAVAFVMAYSKDGKENRYEKQNTGTAESQKGHAAGIC